MFPQLETERFLLLQIEPEDQQFIFKGLSHPLVIPFYGVQYKTFESTKAQMDWYAQLLREGTGIPWKITDKQSGEKLGVVCMYRYLPEHQKAEIGFWLMPQFWHRGIMAEILSTVISYLQHVKALHRIEAFVEVGNIASTHVLEKAGFVNEGIMRDCEMKNGQFISLIIYSLLTTDN